MNDNLPSTAEIAALTARLRALSSAGFAADPVERARFIADKDALLDRITTAAAARDEGDERGKSFHFCTCHGPKAGAEAGLSGAEGPLLDAGPALTAEEAAHELAADGRPLDEARAVVRGYLDAASERVGTSVHLWGLDEADLAAMRADPIERARSAAAVLDVASEALPTDNADVEQADEDGWSQ